MLGQKSTSLKFSKARAHIEFVSVDDSQLCGREYELLIVQTTYHGPAMRTYIIIPGPNGEPKRHTLVWMRYEVCFFGQDGTHARNKLS